MKIAHVAGNSVQPGISKTIADDIRTGKCVLFLGAGVSSKSPDGCPYTYAKGPPTGAQLSELLAKSSGYLSDDRWNLLRVALHFELKRDLGLSRDKLVDFIQAEIGCPEFEPSPALHMLAALPFVMIITTNYDRLFETALTMARTRDDKLKQPQVSVYDPAANSQRDVDLDPTEQRPVVYKLHGDLQQRGSMVITEEDYINFIARMGSTEKHPIPVSLRLRMKTWSTLFIGYSLRDWNLRVLLRALRWAQDAADLKLSYSVDPKPDDLIVAVMEGRNEIQFIPEDLWTFVPRLYELCLGKHYQP